MKKYLALAVACVVTASSVNVMASAMKKTIDAYYSVNKLIVNGVDTSKGSTAFISNGTTYVPLRTVSDALGAEIGWDKKTKTIVINTNGSNDTAGMPQDLPAINNTTPSAPVAPTPSVPVAPTPSVPQKPAVKITNQQARDIALKATGGGNIISIRLDDDYYDPTEYNVPEYEVDIMKGYRKHELTINATTGQVTKHELDD